MNRILPGEEKQGIPEQGRSPWETGENLGSTDSLGKWTSPWQDHVSQEGVEEGKDQLQKVSNAWLEPGGS
jgi:hypothetical protein